MQSYNIESDQTNAIPEPYAIQEEAIQHDQLHNDLQKYSLHTCNSETSSRKTRQQHAQARSLRGRRRSRSTITNVQIEGPYFSQHKETETPMKEKPFELFYDNGYSYEVKEYTEGICSSQIHHHNKIFIEISRKLINLLQNSQEVAQNPMKELKYYSFLREFNQYAEFYNNFPRMVEEDDRIQQQKNHLNNTQQQQFQVDQQLIQLHDKLQEQFQQKIQNLENIQIKLTNSVYLIKDNIIENNSQENGNLPLPFSQHQKQNPVYQPKYLLQQPSILNQSIPNENPLDFHKFTFKHTNSILIPAQYNEEIQNNNNELPSLSNLPGIKKTNSVYFSNPIHNQIQEQPSSHQNQLITNINHLSSLKIEEMNMEESLVIQQLTNPMFKTNEY